VLTVAFEKQSESEAMWALSLPIPFQPPLHAGAGGYFAPHIRAYMRRSKAPDHIGILVALKDRQNALKNPYAHLHEPDITFDSIKDSMMLWDPIRYARPARRPTAPAPWCWATRPRRRRSRADGRPRRGSRAPPCAASRPCSPAATRCCPRRARVRRRRLRARPASPTPAARSTCVEMYVPFSWFEPMWLENLGFAAEGEGWKLVEDGVTEIDGDLPVNCCRAACCRPTPSARRACCASPRRPCRCEGQAGEHQVDGARTAVGHAYGGGSQFFAMWVVGADPARAHVPLGARRGTPRRRGDHPPGAAPGSVPGGAGPRPRGGPAQRLLGSPFVMTGPLGELTAEIIWQSSPDALLLVGPDGTVVWTNRPAEALFGHSAVEFAKLTVEDLLPVEVAGHHVGLREGFATAPVRRPMGAGRQLEGRTRDGDVIPVQVSLSPLRLAGESYVLAAVRDVSAHVITEQRLREAMRERWVARDRERIARDLHDDVIQEIFAVGLGLQALASSTLEPDELRPRLSRAVDELDAIVATIRRVIFDVTRPELDDMGVRAAVVEVIADVIPVLGFEPSLAFRGDVDRKVPPSLVAELLPVLREALTNVARHAEATRAHVEIEVHRNHLRLVVMDDGRGLSGRPDGDHRGHGLTNIADRAVRRGGTCLVGPGEESGTRIEWRVPIDGETTEDHE
jgi:acetyl-CoA C-acetyltransferase